MGKYLTKIKLIFLLKESSGDENSIHQVYEALMDYYNKFNKLDYIECNLTDKHKVYYD